MPNQNTAALDFLLTRRSRPAKTLRSPPPGRAELLPLLRAALRVPDHGKLEPWRLVVLERPALERLAVLAKHRAADLGLNEEQAGKGISQFADSPMCVAVIFSPKDSPKIPHIEQLLSSSAVCLSLLNAALAAGWGAAWLTGWPAYDTAFCHEGLGVVAGESIVGFVHIGTESAAPPERPRPDLAAHVTWMET